MNDVNPDTPSSVVPPELAQTGAMESDIVTPTQIGAYTERIAGELVARPKPTERHQMVLLSVASALRSYTRIEPGRGSVKLAPLEVHFDDETILEPDLIWLRADNTSCVPGKAGAWYGIPDLVVEVTSPATGKRDRVKKYELYERFGVPELWLVHPAAAKIEVWERVKGWYRPRGLFGRGTMLISPILEDLDVLIDELFVFV